MAEIKNLEKAARRIKMAVKNQERIILYGDADVDGALSVIILEEAIEGLGARPGQITAYFPNRQKEGYGLNPYALKLLAKKGKGLLITLDCGISNVGEVDLAKRLGFEVIILDHHQVSAKMPKASIIVDPFQRGERYPFKPFAAAGVIYRLVKVLLPSSSAAFSELAAIATLFDQVPLEGENKKLVREGLLALPYTKRPGLKALFAATNFTAKLLSKSGPDLPSEVLDETRQKIVSPLAAGLVVNHLSETYSLLREKSAVGAKKMARLLIKKAKDKKETIKKMFARAEAKMGDCSTLVFDGYSDWPVAFLGPTASKVCQKHKLPCFLFRKGKTESKGAVRVPSGLDAVKAMRACGTFLIPGFGGHAAAAGFTIKTKNLAKFEKCLTEYFQKLSD